MTDEDLKTLVDKLYADNSKDEASFGIFEYGGGPDESCIRANKPGLQLFAAELLQSSIDSKKVIADKEKNIIPLDNGSWLNETGDTFVHYIEPFAATRQKQLDEPTNENSKLTTTFFNIGCWTLAIFLLVCLGLGLLKIFSLIFG